MCTLQVSLQWRNLTDAELFYLDLLVVLSAMPPLHTMPTTDVVSLALIWVVLQRMSHAMPVRLSNARHVHCMPFCLVCFNCLTVAR